MESVPNTASPQDDGAGEKLVDEKNGHHSKGIEVKYVSPSNGEAKIDIENLKSAFAGMGKEELMKFANDPFWVRTRWFLFILFWVLWIAMLAGAIAIIVLAPKCAPPSPKEWWEQSPLYKVDVASFSRDTKLQGNLKGFTTKLDYLSSLGVKTVVLSNILKVSDKESDGFDEFKTIATSYGTLEDLKELISAAKEKGMQLLLTLVPNHSSLKNPLFTTSPSNDSQGAPLSPYYVWADAKGFTTEEQPIPPNNWLSKVGGSAWEWNKENKKFYLHQFSKDEPDFNFHNPEVINYFNDVMEFWLKQGVAGFYIERAAYLLEDSELGNETRTRDIDSATHMDYEFYNHARTANRPELATLLRKWSSLASNYSGILIVDNVSVANNRSIAHLVVNPQTLNPYPQFSVEELKTLINNTLTANPWPTWQVKIRDQPEGSDLSQGMLLSTMLLPGTPITLSGQELGLKNLQEIPWDKVTGSGNDVKYQQENPHSILNAYKTLVEARASPSILHGTMQLEVINGTSVLAYTRIKSGNPGYLIVFNAGSDEGETEIDVRMLDSIPEELTLLLASDASSMANKTKVASRAVQLPVRSVAVFRFVPKQKE